MTPLLLRVYPCLLSLVLCLAGDPPPLPTNVVPTAYNLTITPNLDKSTFTGTVSIGLDVITNTDSIVLNVHNESILISSLKPDLSSGTPHLKVAKVVADGESETVTFKLNGLLKKQKGVVLKISYEGIMGSSSDGKGFYKVLYHDSTQLAITQFEPVDARRAFPCFDDIKYRTPFKLTMNRLPGQVSLFNMPLVSSAKSKTSPWMQDVFETSPPMPTYLVAFGVTNMPSKSDGGRVRLFAQQSNITRMKYALSVVQPILDTMAEYTGVPYPLPKLDLVAEFYKGGAMENWGLLTFNDGILAYDPDEPDFVSQTGTMKVIVHEIAHQWFGGVVTAESWRYLWLNEGFATYLQHKITDLMHPEWKLGSASFVKDAVQGALDSDVGKPRAMSSSVVSSFWDYFDYASYTKGGSVLRMFENFLTTPVWKDGLNRYLTENKFGTGTPEKLFSAFKMAATKKNLPVVKITETLEGWTKNPGYPLITVSRVSGDKAKTRYRIIQTPYNLDDKTAKYMWNVPLRYTTDKKREFDPAKAALHWLYPSDPSTSQLTVDTAGWVLCNVDVIGFYRVNYDPENWRNLKTQLLSNSAAIPEVSRSQLVDDAMHLVQSGDLDFSQALDFLEYLVHETAYLPWEAFRNNFYNYKHDEKIVQAGYLNNPKFRKLMELAKVDDKDYSDEEDDSSS